MSNLIRSAFVALNHDHTHARTALQIPWFPEVLILRFEPR